MDKYAQIIYLPFYQFNMQKWLLYFVFTLLSAANAMAQSTTESEKVRKTCIQYIEGFYEGDSLKIIRCMKPSLYKFGYWKNKTSGIYEADGFMTYRQAIDYAQNMYNKKKKAKEGSPKEVVVYDVMNKIASAKITAWWGVDYLLLSKNGDAWQIEQVLWEGPLEKK